MLLRKRTLLAAVAVLLCAAALFAIVVLAVGRLGPTEWRILQTTMTLAGYGVLAVPVVAQAGQRHPSTVAVLAAAAVGAGALSGVVAVWWRGQAQGRVAATALILAVLAAQASVLTSRRRADDPRIVGRLYAGSLATGGILAVLLFVQIWAEVDSSGYARALGVVIVLDLLLVALQPLLARLRPRVAHYRLRLTLDGTASSLLEVDAPDLATAAARAIREAEREGGHVHGFDLEEVVTPR